MAAHQACVRSLPSCFICASFAFIPPYSLRAQGCKLRGEHKPERTLIWATRFCIPRRYAWVYGSMATMVLVGPLRRTAGIAGCCFCCKCSLLAMSLGWYASQCRPSATNLLHFTSGIACSRHGMHSHKPADHVGAFLRRRCPKAPDPLAQSPTSILQADNIKIYDNISQCVAK